MVMQIAAGIFVGVLMLAALGIVIFVISAYISKLNDYRFFSEEETVEDDWFPKETVDKIRTPKEPARKVVKEPPLVTEIEFENIDVRKPKKKPAPKTRKRYDFDE